MAPSGRGPLPVELAFPFRGMRILQGPFINITFDLGRGQSLGRARNEVGRYSANRLFFSRPTSEPPS